MIRSVSWSLAFLAAAAWLLSAQPSTLGTNGGDARAGAKAKGSKAGKSGRTAAAKSSAQPVTIVELFTSEGCSSCPPADQIVSRYAQSSSGIVILGEHVDYWDGLGWRDRYSSPLFSARQQDYGAAMRTANVFTPQVVVNGQYEALGSDENSVYRAMSQGGRPKQAKVELETTDNGTLKLRIKDLPGGPDRRDNHKYEVILAITESGLQTAVSGGENGGRTIQHVPVVHSMTRLTTLDGSQPGEYGAEARLNLRSSWKQENLKIVVFLQDQSNRHIIGAAAIEP